ncbi:MAG: T9SS type A sorting domain-containing protein, partial [Bacteroidota bacterium]
MIHDEDGNAQTRTIRIMNGDTVINETVEGAHWIDVQGNTHSLDDSNVHIFQSGGSGSGNEEEIGIEVVVKADGDTKEIIIHRALQLIVNDLSDDEAEKFADADALEVKKLDFFPNPSDGLFTLRFKLKDKKQPAELRIFNIDGANVYAESLQGISKYEKEIDLRALSAGTYFLSIAQGDEKIVKKLVIQ